MPENCNPCISNVCASRAGDCGNIIPFANLLNLPVNFSPNPAPGWQNLKLSGKSYLHCLLEPCLIQDAHLVFTDPCREIHDLQKLVAHVKRARVLGSIEYIISAQSTDSDASGDPASVSDFYAIPVDHVVEYLDDRNITQCSVIVDSQNLRFDDPAEYLYGNNEALRIKGEFVLHLGYIKNGSFENAFTGWTQHVPPGATAETVTEFEDYGPVEGCYFALLKTDGPLSYNSVQQEFFALAGETISGWAFFKTNDYMPFNDRYDVSILSGSTVLNTPFSASVSTVGNYGKTPWTKWEYTLPATGAYTVKAEITNFGDSSVDSFMGLDAVQLISHSSM